MLIKFVFSFSVKPKSPSVTSAVFQPESNQAMIYIKTPYDKDFLKTSNQLFQYYIWSAAGSELVMCDLDLYS
jgi:hypothetical protein